MTTMLEKMAREIGDADHSLGDRDFGWDANPDWWREGHLRTARAALLAIRDADADVFQATAAKLAVEEVGKTAEWRRTRTWVSRFSTMQVRKVWIAMIDAILGESDSSTPTS